MDDVVQKSYDLMGFFVRSKRDVNQERLHPKGVGMGLYPEYMSALKSFGAALQAHSKLVERGYAGSDSVQKQEAAKSLQKMIQLQEKLKSLRKV